MHGGNPQVHRSIRTRAMRARPIRVCLIGRPLITRLQMTSPLTVAHPSGSSSDSRLAGFSFSASASAESFAAAWDTAVAIRVWSSRPQDEMP
jgi:hypothetical protein